jgi:hypothetical protein
MNEITLYGELFLSLAPLSSVVEEEELNRRAGGICLRI